MFLFYDKKCKFFYFDVKSKRISLQDSYISVIILKSIALWAYKTINRIMRGIDYMSASSKKKLRKEQAAAELTIKQQKEQIEAKKLRNASIIFIVVMLVVALTAATVLIVRAYTNSGIREKGTVAAIIGDRELNTVEFNYFYIDHVNNYYKDLQNVYGELTNYYLMMMGLDPTQSLDSQISNQETGETWAEAFQKEAMEKAKGTYALYDKALSENFTMSEDAQIVLDYTVEQTETYALLYGFRNTNDFLRAAYGPGANEETFIDYCTITSIANAYYTAKNDSLVYEDDAIHTYDEEHPLDFTSFDYATYYVSYSDYVEGGSEDKNGDMIYTAEEKAKGLEKAEEVAKLLSTAKNVDDLDKAIQDLEINADNTSAGTSKNEDVFYTSIPQQFQQWLSDEERVENDITMIPYETTSTDADGNETSVVSGYYVVVYQGRNENLRPLANVRHILVGFEGGTTDEHGSTSYSDAEKAAAKESADALLQTWKAGDATEESFIALVKEHSDDQASVENGGLYEDLHPESNYVPSFLNWAIDENREVGDAEVVEGPYGYHIMYYASDDERTNRDRLIENYLRATDLQTWYDEIVNAVTLDIKDTSYVMKGIIMASV